jgi:hypothetical protein
LEKVSLLGPEGDIHCGYFIHEYFRSGHIRRRRELPSHAHGLADSFATPDRTCDRINDRVAPTWDWGGTLSAAEFVFISLIWITPKSSSTPDFDLPNHPEWNSISG